MCVCVCVCVCARVSPLCILCLGVACGLASQASALDPAEPVTITVDLGGRHKLETIDIAWEFPAKSFTVSVTSDDVKWMEVFATDSNVLTTTTIPLGSVYATKARVVMHEVRVTFPCA